MVYEPDDKTRLLEATYARLGTRSPACPCGETDPLCMTGRYPHILCYECQLKAHGRSPIETQHPASQYNDPDYEVPMPGNPHRVWDAWKYLWPRDTWLNPEGSPLLKAATSVHAFHDFLRGLTDRLLGWVPELLEALDAALTETLGPRWWEKIGMKQ